MSATPRRLLHFLCALAALVAAIGCTAAEIPADGGYRTWLESRAAFSEAQPGATNAVIAAVLREHLCGGDAACFPDSAWRALDARAQRSDDPTVLTLAANVASYRPGQKYLAQRWSRVAAVDRDNAYPLVLQAGAEWDAGHHARALEILKAALERPRDDDHFGATLRLLRPVLETALPSPEQLPPCTLEVRETTDPPSAAELRALVLFEIGSDVAFPNHLGNVNALCKDASGEEAERRTICSAVGAHLAAHATSVLSRSMGLALQRFVAEPAQQEAIAEAQRHASDELHRKLWWIGSAPSAAQRAAASEYWLDQLANAGEIAAADALVRHFGEPPAESREQRETRETRQMEKARACYARTHHDK